MAGGSSSPPVRSSATSGLPSPAGRGRLTAACTGKCGPAAVRLPLPPHGPAQGDGLGELVVERGYEAEHAPAAADEVEARDLAGEHGGVAPVLGQAHPDAEQHPGHRGAEAGSQHEGVAQVRPAHEQDVGAVGCRPDRLGAEPGHVTCLEEPCVHGDAD